MNLIYQMYTTIWKIEKVSSNNALCYEYNEWSFITEWFQKNIKHKQLKFRCLYKCIILCG